MTKKVITRACDVVLQPHPEFPNTTIVPLSKDQVALIDTELAEEIGKYRWHYNARTNGMPGYACRSSKTATGYKALHMHREIILLSGIDPATFEVVDHISRDTLDNRRANLRPCTVKENLRNRRRLPGRTGFKGVRLRQDGQRIRWVARIRIAGRIIERCCRDRIEAALTYDDLARQHHGEFAALNFPREGEVGA